MGFKIKVPAFIAVAVVVLGMTFGFTTEASASNDGHLFLGNDGCFYRWSDYLNGYDLSLCPQADGTLSVWASVNGQWVFTASMLPMADGSTWVNAVGSGGWILYPPAKTMSIGGSSSSKSSVYGSSGMIPLANPNQIFLNGGIYSCDYTYEC